MSKMRKVQSPLPKIIPLRRQTSFGPKLYFDQETTKDTWQRNQDALFYEDEKTYINGTITSDHSTTLFRRELRKISPYF